MYGERLTGTLFDGEGMHCHQPAALHLTHPDTAPKRPSDMAGTADPKLLRPDSADAALELALGN